MTPATEIELKLALVAGTPAGARDALRHIRLERTAIDDVYFDTPDRSLRRRGLVLRVRRDGERWMQTLKAGPSSRSLVPVRGEWEVPLPSGKKRPALDLERFDIAPLRVLMRAGFDAAALQPVFRTRVTRRRGTVQHGESDIEVALDAGELRTRAEGAGRRKRIAELELELKAGRPEDVLDLGSDIVRHAKGLTFVPAVRTKSERGYALASGVALEVVRASGRGFAEQTDARMSPPVALRAVVRHGLAILVANADALRDAPTPEHVHQARVALRRMRSAFRLLDAEKKEVQKDLRAETAWLAQSLGPVRDWDVLVDETLPSIIATSRMSPEGVRRLQRRAERYRARSLERARSTVASKRYARLVLQMARWTITPFDEAGATAALDASALLEREADRFFRSARAFARLNAHKRHRVRIHAKRLRYALDLFAPRLQARSASDYIAALASLQDTLGALNDTVVALERLAPHLKARNDEAALREWFDQTEKDLVAEAGRQLRGLARRVRPWGAR